MNTFAPVEIRMTRTKPTAVAVGPILIALLTLALLVGCSGARLVSDYDETTDKYLTSVQQTADDFISELKDDAPSDKNAYDKRKKFYTELDQQLRRLEFRVNSIPGNNKTVKLVNDIRTVLLASKDKEKRCKEDGRSLEDLHCLPANSAKGPSRIALEIAQRNVNQTIGAALALELAKKQGSEQNE